MRTLTYVVLFTVVSLAAISPAQQTSTTAVPNLINYSGALRMSSNLSGSANAVGVTFAIYHQQDDGAPIWLETQNVTPDSAGHYTILLGNTKAEGIPAELFNTKEQLWLGVQMEGEAEQPRVLLVSVPYAMKAADAETLGGRPATDYVLSAREGSSSCSTAAKTSALGTDASSQNAVPALGAISGSGTTNFIPIWTSSSKLGNSTIFEAGRKVGIGFVFPPHHTLDVAGDANIMTGTQTPALIVDQLLEGLGVDVLAVGSALFAKSTSTDFFSIGVEGEVNSSFTHSAGVRGENNATSGETVGVAGQVKSNEGAGVRGVNVDPSAFGGRIVPAAGVWGDTGKQLTFGILGTADDGIGVVALNDSPSGLETLGARNDESVNPFNRVFQTEGHAFGGTCVIDVSGNLVCNGTKSAAVRLADGRNVALYTVEAPENWFEDVGSGKLTSGIATVNLEPTFAETVNTAIEYHVFLTPKGECEGLYVANVTPQGFEVRELRGGHSDVSFDYRIMARRKGYEKIRLADVTEQLSRPVLKR